ncbi:MAG: hypothetical protein CO186_07885 [Zetaproteobacteria bacterium CG_4_9_14_3_um_filter_49_83]|nr:MAG: hypothetical protein AUJ56_04650 [Zetaproteobacteria bacterium CG1_02_49_23]PIQ33358.1 MAG: hypothetical protein COW62_05565 [Zetaproteobacteria bacterium CG17_big_fil_post_rev_8_21_14_2_50_50_13]PIV31484.1 MAG: hypothetical protein COS35_01150 [Zetaproteobacteria bacterium CG02_land_8_20_14_3_00_50_9]PIY57090.1 MAG: hypothetical protein COZ00_00745 [Zetaproteobacteria bacterium CG_4_10_14_0_8_um_filter_49_80]PJA35056.1 MAG: hypothetical protein CO186_07885 [Zetaproteobacteria bacterium
MAQSLRDDVLCQAWLYAPMKCLMQLDDPVTLDVLRTHLQQCDIQCWVMDAGMGELHPKTGLFPYRVMVSDEDMAAALVVAKDLELL